jgi:uncharacterized membrane protein
MSKALIFYWIVLAIAFTAAYAVGQAVQKAFASVVMQLPH